MRKGFFLLLFCLMSTSLLAQRQITVIDMDTNLPVKDVSVKAGHARSVQTDVLGRAEIPVVFDSIAFIHIRYEHEHLAFAEVGDTMYLLPKEHLLPEVTITEASPQMKAMFKAWAQAGAMMGAAEAPQGMVTFDFANMIDRRGRRDKQHLERARQILKEWDKKK